MAGGLQKDTEYLHQKLKKELTAAGFSKFTINDSLLDNFYIVISERDK